MHYEPGKMLATRSRALCISFEGIDGVGKSTQAQMLARNLEQKGFSVAVIHLLKRKQKDIVHELMENLISDKVTHPFQTDHPYADTLMRISAISYFSNKIIKPSLERGTSVIIDRYVDSIYAYQTCKILQAETGRLLDTGAPDPRLSIMRKLNDIVSFCNVVEPHLTFLLDMSPKSIFEEGRWDVKLTRNDIPFLERVRETFLLSQTLFPHRIKTINACEGTREEISASILKTLNI